MMNRGLNRFANPPQPGGLPWPSLIHAGGTLAQRPTASPANAGFYYFATDVNSGTVYRSTGSAWQQVAAPAALGIPVLTTQGGTGATTAYAGKDNLSVQSGSIASATTTDLSTTTGDLADVTGSATITSFGTMAAGVERTLRFTGSAVLTYNATSLILPGAANITTAAGDVGVFRSLGSGNWQCVGYSRASGLPVVSSGASLVAANTFTVGPNVFQAGAAGNKVVVFQGAASQTANLTEWQDSTAAVLGYVDPAGIVNPAGYGGLIDLVECRLTLTSATPFTTADVTGAGTVYCTPYRGNQILLYYTSTTRWKPVTFSEITKSLSSLTSGKNYDVFVYDAGPLVAPAIRATSNGSNSGTATCTLPTRQSGDLLLVWNISGAAVTAGSGWTRQFNTNVNGANFALFTKTSDGTDSTSPFATSNFGSYACQAIPNATIDVLGTTATGTGTSLQASSITPTATPDLLITGYAVGFSTPAITLPGSQTTANGNTASGHEIQCGQENITGTSATGTRTATAASCSWGAVSVALKLVTATSGLTLELSSAWTNDTTRADALTTQDGILVKSADKSRRYLGTIRATGTTTTEDSLVNRYLYNHYHRDDRPTVGASRVAYGGYVSTGVAYAYASGDLSTSSSSYGDATGFGVAVGAGEIWALEFNLSCTSATPGGLGIQFTYSGSATAIAWSVVGCVTNSTTLTTFSSTSVSSGSGPAVMNNFSATAPQRVVCWFQASTAGTLQLQFAATTNGTTVKILKGSYMTARRLQ